MRRVSTMIALTVALLLHFVAIAGHSRAQDATPQAGIIPEPIHPIVGTWIVNDLGPGASPSLTSFTSEGIVTDVEADGGVGLGVWQPTGERTAALTMVVPLTDGEFYATVQINVTVSIDASGDSGTADYTYTAVQSDGTVGESGTGSVTITRMSVQPLDAAGTPMAAFPVWSPSSGGGGENPEATPGS